MRDRDPPPRTASGQSARRPISDPISRLAAGCRSLVKNVHAAGMMDMASEVGGSCGAGEAGEAAAGLYKLEAVLTAVDRAADGAVTAVAAERLVAVEQAARV